MKKIKKILGTTALCTALLGVGTGCSLNFDPTTSSDKDDPVVVCTQTDLDVLNQRLAEKQTELDSVNALLTEVETLLATERDNKEALLSEKTTLELEQTELLSQIEELELELSNFQIADSNVWTNDGLRQVYEYKYFSQILKDIKLNGTNDYEIVIRYDGVNQIAIAFDNNIPDNSNVYKVSSYAKKYYYIPLINDVSFVNENGDYILTMDSFDADLQLDIETEDEATINSYRVLSARGNVFDENYSKVDIQTEINRNINESEMVNLDDYLQYSGTYYLTVQFYITVTVFDEFGLELESRDLWPEFEIEIEYIRG